MVDLVPLAQLRCGQFGRIGQLLGQPSEVHRLEEMGLRTGTEVKMVQSGEPCIICLGGTRLCFRPGEAFGVMVCLGESA